MTASNTKSRKESLPTDKMKREAKKLGIRLTTKKGKKSRKTLGKQILNKKKTSSYGKKTIIKFRNPGIDPLFMPGQRGSNFRFY
ncbi:MAG: hypothetical protein R3321_13965 [Nitrososphaeraceae archaeon]|nr:hypothetical protein [Nitrososphaeraceae archaeon]